MVEKFVKMWYNAFAYERQIEIDRTEGEECFLSKGQEDGD